MIYKPKNFKIYELVDRSPVLLRTQVGWQVLDPSMLRTIQALRDLFGPATINNWKWETNPGKIRRWSGYRPFYCREGADYSQHRRGHAFDLIFRNYFAQEIRTDMRKRPNRKAYKHITTVENKVSWLHIDNRPRTKAGIVFINP